MEIQKQVTVKLKLLIWYRAIFQDYWYWRVRYEDGKLTRRLSYGEAKNLQNCFGGKLYIDYNVLKPKVEITFSEIEKLNEISEEINTQSNE